MRRFLGTLIISLVLVATALGVVWSRHQSRKVFVELQVLEHQRDELNVEWGRLQLEQATWAEAGRVEQLARGELGLVAKDPGQIMVIVR
jgi:cell division protein FtsL